MARPRSRGRTRDEVGPNLEPTFTNQEAIDPAVIDRIPEQSRVEIFSSNGMTCKLVVAPAVREDLGWWRHTNPTRLEHIRRMLGAVLTDPFGGIGKPEPLRGLSNTWSRRIDKRHRLVYRVYDDRIEIAAGRYHYGQ